MLCKMGQKSRSRGGPSGRSVVQPVALGRSGALGLGVLSRMWLTRADGPRRYVPRLIAHVRGLPRVLSDVVGIRPLGGVRFAHRVVERVVWVALLRLFVGLLAFVHAWRLPVRLGPKRVGTDHPVRAM